MKKCLLVICIIVASCNTFKNFNSVKESISNVEVKTKKTIKVDNIVGTVYHLEAKQCDSNPYETADGTNLKGKDINKLRYVALSRDLIKDEFRDKLHKTKGQWKGKFSFGDTITVISDNKELCGKWIVKDCMNKRFKNRMDFMQDKENGFIGKFNNITILKEV